MGHGRWRVAVLAVVAVAGGFAGCSASEPTSSTRPADRVAPPGPRIDAHGVRIERTWVGPAGRADDIAATGGQGVVALASLTGTGSADTS